jgi:hypothetical protein
MTTSEIVSICSISILLMTFSLSFWTFRTTTMAARVAQTQRMHELWWSEDMTRARNEVFALCRQMALGSGEVQAMIDYYVDPIQKPEPPCRASFLKLMSFFCNLEICIESKLVEPKLATKLFGQAHFIDYLPLIVFVRNGIQQAHKDRPASPWLQLTLDLERRFSKIDPVFAKRAAGAGDRLLSV